MMMLLKKKMKKNNEVHIYLDAWFMAGFAVLLSLTLVLGCVSRPNVSRGSVFRDQERTIAEQRERIEEMERVVLSIQVDLGSAADRIGRLEQGNTELEEWFGAVDEFVTDVIRAKQALEGLLAGD